MDICPKCGNKINPEDKFCQKCGNKVDSNIVLSGDSELNKENISIKSDDSNSQNNQQNFSSQNKIKCPFCGSMIDSNVKKCLYCGEWLYGKPQEPKHDTLIILGYIFAIFLPLAGLIIGIYLLTRDNDEDHKAGKYQIILAIFIPIIIFLFILVVSMLTAASVMYLP